MPNFWHLRHLLDSCRSFRAVVRVLAISTPNLISEFADDLERKCMIRWAVVWLLEHFSGGLIHRAMVMSPGCNELARSTFSRSSRADGLNVVGTNSTIVG